MENDDLCDECLKKCDNGIIGIYKYFENTVHLGTKLGEFKSYLESFRSDIKQWKNYYTDEDIMQGEEIHLLEQVQASQIINEIEDHFKELFENYLYPQVNDE